MMTFKEGRVAVVTGGAGQIGRETCRMFCERGVSVALVDIFLEPAEKVASEIREKGGNIKAYQMDVENTASVDKAAAQILADFGHVDILINNAGKWIRQPFVDMTEDQWLHTINLNLNGVFRVTKAFLPSLIDNGYGRIINLASISGEVGLPLYCDYSASKGGVILMTKTLAMELAKKNITVNAVSPGMIVPGGMPGTKTTWLERSGSGEEVANLILFLASDDSSYITGVDYTIDGGRILGPRFSDL